MSQASLTSAITAVQMVDNVAYQIDFTGAPVGTFSVQVSINYEPGRGPNSEPANPGTWVDLTLDPAIIASGSPDTAFIDINQTGSAYIRLVYTRTSGSGTLNAMITAKAV